MQETYPPDWAKNATTPAPPAETIFNQEYQPDWANIPAGFDWVAVDASGWVYAFTTKPDSNYYTGIWANGIRPYYLGTIDAPPGDHWETMLYQRPTNTAA